MRSSGGARQRHRPGRRRSPAGLLGLALSLLASCTGTAPPPWTSAGELVVAQGGGFTGQVQGVRLRATGEVVAFRQLPDAAPEVLHRSQVSPARMHSLVRDWLRLTADWQSAGTGNITTRVTLDTGTMRREWTWPGSTPPSQAPEGVADWLARIDRLQEEHAP